MLEVKLWHNRKKTKNLKIAKMVVLIKTCDQYPSRFNFGNFSYSTCSSRPPPLPTHSPPSLSILSAGEIQIFRKLYSRMVNLLIFYYFFGDKKKLLEALLNCTFIRSLLNCFDLPSYSSKLKKRFTLRILCYCV